MNQSIFRNQFAVFIMAFYCSAAILQAQEPLKKPIQEEERTKTSMKIVVTSVMVNDQEKALKFYNPMESP